MNVRVVEYDFEREYFEQIFEASTISNNDDEIQLKIGELREFAYMQKLWGILPDFKSIKKKPKSLQINYCHFTKKVYHILKNYIYAAYDQKINQRRKYKHA